jgi:rhodanese-related sulfurtransferase
MKRTMLYRIKIVIMGLLIVRGFFCSLALGAQPAQGRNPGMVISPEAVMQRLQGNQGLTLVDVRMKEQFAAVHIPASIHIPLYALKAKTFLKSHPLVLVNDGFSYAPLEREGARLRKAGFKVWILTNGLYGWKQRGGELQGEIEQQQGLNKISPSIFYAEGGATDRLIINIAAAKGVAARFFPQAVHIPYKVGKGSAFVAAVKKSQVRAKDMPPILVNENGEGYEGVERLLVRSGVREVFFLKGGIAEYSKFAEGRRAMKPPQASGKR